MILLYRENPYCSRHLKELEEDGLVKRTEYMEVPIRVEYEATQAVASLKPIILELAKWGNGLG